MNFIKKYKVKQSNGFHTRVSAKIAYKANLVHEKYDETLYIKRNEVGHKLPMNSMIALTSLAIRQGEEVLIGTDGDKNSDAVDEMITFLEEELFISTSVYNPVDALLDQNVLTTEQLIENISNGLIAVNKENVIIIFNQAAERIMNIKRSEVIGKRADLVLENSKLKEVLDTGNRYNNDKQKIHHTTIITNRSPIIINNEIFGAVAVFRDITDVEELSKNLESTKEIQEKLSHILKNANDGICMVDAHMRMSYVNPKFAKITKRSIDELMHCVINDVLQDRNLLRVLEHKEEAKNLLCKEEGLGKIIFNVSPIYVQGKFKGHVLIANELTDLKKVMHQLNTAELKIKEYQEELIEKSQKGIDEAFDVVIGRSQVMKKSLALSTKAAKTSMTVLIRGESGTGKELIAKSIWKASPRKNAPFISINCAAIPRNLIESELFGHEKGAFTGAIEKKIGKFELANGGVLFLDEIGDLDLSLQVKLLRVLQESELQRVGGNQKIPFDVRIIAATHQDLEKLIQEKRFRMDLYYRLNVIPIHLPPLRERKNDILDLVQFFLNQINEKENIGQREISKEALEHLRLYHWPGNIRELENIVKRMVVFSEGPSLEINDLPEYILNALGYEREPPQRELPFDFSDDEIYPMEAYEKIIIKKALEKYESFNRTGKALGLSHRTVARKARKFGLID